MRKILISLLALWALTTTSRATSNATSPNNYDKYYQNLPVQMPQPSLPTIPDNQLSILDCGGKGDALSMNTQAFSKAISQLSKKGGGHLIVPAGIYVTGLISLKDNIDLHLEKNAIIVFSEDKNDWIKIDETTGQKEDRASTAITASKRKNISITGEGAIDGNGEWWRPVKRSKVSDVEWKQFQEMGGTLNEKGDIWYPLHLKNTPDVVDNMDAQEKVRNHMIRFTDCENVLVQGVTLLNSPRFHLIPTRCKNVIIDGITVKCPWNAQNGDAIDISSCKDVLIVNNIVDAGDDGICMKGGAGAAGVKAGPCENINIQDNTVYHAHGGFVIGSEFSGGMKNIVVRNNTFLGTDTGLRFKSAVKRGGLTENIFIDHIYMTDISGDAIIFETTYWDNHVGAKQQTTPTKQEYLPNFQDIHISNIYVRGCKNGVVAHGDESMIHDITIKDSNIFYNKKDKDIDATCQITLEKVNFSTFAK